MESITGKIFKKITNNHGFSQSQEQMQAMYIQEKEIRMSIKLLYVAGTSEKLWHLLRSHKIRPTFYMESTSCKLLWKQKIKLPEKIKTILFMKLTVVTT